MSSRFTLTKTVFSFKIPFTKLIFSLNRAYAAANSVEEINKLLDAQGIDNLS